MRQIDMMTAECQIDVRIITEASQSYCDGDGGEKFEFISNK